jgi:hypothetical protein
MKLEDVLEVLPMLMPKNFMDQFIFIWGREQWSKMVSQISPRSHYYLKDLKCIYLWLLWTTLWKEYQTLFIAFEPSKALRNSKWNGLYLESLRGQMLLKNKVQWLDLASLLWPPLVGLPLAKVVQVHYDFIIKYSKLRLSSSLKNYYWFFQ